MTTTETPIDADNHWAALKRDLQALSEDVTRLTEKSVGDGQDLVAAELARVRRVLGELSGRVSAQGKSSLGDLEEIVRKRPVTTVAVSVAMGFLAAALLTRRR